MTACLYTCRTSAAKNLPREAHFGPRWVDERGGVGAAARILRRSFSTYRLDDDTALQRNLSAEIRPTVVRRDLMKKGLVLQGMPRMRSGERVIGERVAVPGVGRVAGLCKRA